MSDIGEASSATDMNGLLNKNKRKPACLVKC